jgi:hypothetical protein
MNADDALRLAIKLAVDAGYYERAAELLGVAKRHVRPSGKCTFDRR